MNKAMKEVRMNQDSITNLPESRKVEGYAVVFQSESNDLGGFKQFILNNSNSLSILNSNSFSPGILNSNSPK